MSSYVVEGNFNNIERDVFDNLPHGSGIDGRWAIYKKKGYYKCLNSYHVMNENGMYNGWADFSIIISKRDPYTFRLHFHGDNAQRLNKRYMLRDYLEDTIAYWAGEIFAENL